MKCNLTYFSKQTNIFTWKSALHCFLTTFTWEKSWNRAFIYLHEFIWIYTYYIYVTSFTSLYVIHSTDEQTFNMYSHTLTVPPYHQSNALIYRNSFLKSYSWDNTFTAMLIANIWKYGFPASSSIKVTKFIFKTFIFIIFMLHFLHQGPGIMWINETVQSSFS